MTGSSLAPIIIPIVMLPVLAIWLFMVYHAANHPDIKHPEAARPRGSAESYSAEAGLVPQQADPVTDPADPSARPREEVSAGGARR
jgi:hypothetical protein